jgi:hypothetical integral membrane protein (TIGR02206 family)
MRLETFSPVHLAIVASVPLVAWGLAALGRRGPDAARRIRLALAAAIASNELAWYGYLLAHGEVAPPHGLPLELCDVVLWLTVYALLTPRAWALESIYYLGLAGSGMAVLTPDVGAPFPSYPGVKFFVAHGSVVAAILFLVWTGALRPRRGSWWRVLLGVNAYAALVGLFNARFGTNYMYLCEKPRSRTLLDLFGPWPWYLLGAEVVAVALFFALYLPMRPRPTRPRSS